MPNRTLIEQLNSAWLFEQLGEVTDNDSAWVFLQEPAFIGFGVVTRNYTYFPPDITPDWTLTSDLRLFGEKGEWHVWRDWDGEHYARLRTSDQMNDAITEHHFLWGTEKKDIDDGPWTKLTEDRGTEIWLPLAKKVEDADIPLRLRLEQIVTYDKKTHIAGITDAALVALTTANRTPIQPPKHLPRKSLPS